MVQGPLAGCQLPSWRGGGLEALLGRQGPLGCVLALSSSSSTRPGAAAWSMLFTAVLATGIATACLLQGVKRRHPAVRRFRVVRRERVLPVARTGGGVQYPLSVLDKMLCPMIVINMHFFYHHRIDAQRVKASLARLITRHPFLGGTLKGYLSWATVSCDDRGVEVVEQEADFSRQDLHFRSIALERLSSAEPCGFGAGRALDLLQAFFWGAPVLRVRISYLRDGGSALSVSVGHTVMDAKSIMKIIEVWAVDTREPLDVTDEEVQHHIARRQHYQQQQAASRYRHKADPPRRPSDAAAPAPPQMLRTPSTAPPLPQQQQEGRGSATGRYGSSILLDAKEMEELATAHSGSHRLSLWELWGELCNSMRQSIFMIQHFLLVGLQTRTLFFPDHMVAQLKDQVMADIKEQQHQQQQDEGEEEEEGKAPGGQQQPKEEQQQQAVAVGAGLVVRKQPQPSSSSSRRRSSGGAGGPSFVSSNDVVTAAFWKLLQSLECRPRGPSCMRMNVDVRAMIARPMLRARLTSHSGDLSSLPLPSSASPSSDGGLDTSLSSSTASTASTASIASSSDLPSAASSPGLLSLLERDPLPESFFIGNGVLQVTAYHEQPQDASISELAQAVRGAVSSMDAATALKELGALKKKIRHMDNLGILLGPMGCDWRFDRDVVFSSFNPLSIDADFGAGPSHTYHLDLLPALNMYTHIHRGVDVNSGKAGLFVQTTLPRPVMAELLAKHQHLLPAMPPPATTPQQQQQHKEEEEEEARSSRHPPLPQQQQEAALPSPIPIATPKPPPACRPAMAEERRAEGQQQQQQQQHLEEEEEEQAEDQGDEEEEEDGLVAVGRGGSRTARGPAATTAEPPSSSSSSSPSPQQQQLSPATTCSTATTSSRRPPAALVEPSAS